MAELLLKRTQATNSDKIKQDRGCYGPGDIVVAMPDGHTWGKEEGLPKFWIIRCPEIPQEKLEYYISPKNDPNTKERLARRQYQVLVDQLDPKLQETLELEGSIDIDWPTLQKFLYDKDVNATEFQKAQK